MDRRTDRPRAAKPRVRGEHRSCSRRSERRDGEVSAIRVVSEASERCATV